MLSHKINLLNDAMFKALFRSIEARGVVSEVISNLTGIDKEILMKADYQGGELPKKKITEKGKISDVIIKIDDNNKIIVEMNQNYTNNIFNKNISYAFSIASETILKDRIKNKYEYPRVILISFDNFDRFNTKKGVVCCKIQDEEGHIETDQYTSYHILLDKKVNREYNNIEVEKLVNFLNQKDIEGLKSKYEGDEEYMSCIRKVEELSTDPNFVGYYDLEEAHRQDIASSYDTGLEEGMEKGIKQGIEQGIEKGIEQGIEKRNIEIAKNMLKEKIEISLISKMTGLSVDTIKELDLK